MKGSFSSHTARGKRIEVLLVCLLISACCVLTYNRNAVWQSDFSLWQDVIAKTPGKYRAYFHLGNAFLLQRDYDGADRAYQYILSREHEISSPSFRSLLHNHIGVIRLQQGKHDDAIAAFRKALDAMPDYPTAMFNLGVAFERAGKTGEAEDAYRRTLVVAPGFIEARNALGTLLLRRQEPAAALEQFEQALAINPSYIDAARNREIAIRMMQSRQGM